MREQIITRIIPMLLAACLVTVFCGAATSNTRNTRSVRIFYDSTLPSNVVSNINSTFTTASNAFYNTFVLRFTRESTSLSSLLDGGTCSQPINSTCILASHFCGNPCGGIHHRSDTRLLYKIPSSPGHSLGIVGHALCYSTSNSHEKSGGIATIPSSGRRALITNSWHESLNFLMQHELSHNLGARDHGGNLNCVMNWSGTYTNVWCSSCFATIHSNI